MPSLATCANLETAKTEAKAYTDQKVADLRQYVDDQDASTLQSANAYTDAAVDAFDATVEALDERLDTLELHPPVVATRTVLGHVKLATAETFPVSGGVSDELVVTPAFVDAAIAAQVSTLVDAAIASLTDAFGS